MARIKIFQSETYPSEIQKVRECILDFSESTKKELIETEYLNDYASSKLWDTNSDFGRVHNKLMTVLENHSIIAYPVSYTHLDVYKRQVHKESKKEEYG